jgi:hypothetical protein
MNKERVNIEYFIIHHPCSLFVIFIAGKHLISLPAPAL